MNLNIFRNLNERDKFVLNCISTNSCSVREIERQHAIYMKDEIYRSVNKLELLNLVEKHGDGYKMSLSVTPEGTEVIAYLEISDES